MILKLKTEPYYCGKSQASQVSRGFPAEDGAFGRLPGWDGREFLSLERFMSQALVPGGRSLWPALRSDGLLRLHADFESVSPTTFALRRPDPNGIVARHQAANDLLKNNLVISAVLTVPEG